VPGFILSENPWEDGKDNAGPCAPQPGESFPGAIENPSRTGGESSQASQAFDSSAGAIR